MSIKQRVKNLETRANSDFRVAYPVRLDADGHVLCRRQDDSNCHSIAFRCSREEAVVKREPSEDLRNLLKRAGNIAAQKFEGAIFVATEPH